jgi:hypothetical protein
MRGRGREKIGAEAAGDKGWGGGGEREKRGGEGGEESSVKQREKVWRTCEKENINYEMCE